MAAISDPTSGKLPAGERRNVETRRVGVTDGTRLWLTEAGRRSDAVYELLDGPAHAGELAVTAAAHGIREVWALPVAVARWGLPAELPVLRPKCGHPHHFTDRAIAAGWDLNGPDWAPKGLTPWLAVWRPGDDGSNCDIVFPSWDRRNPFSGLGDGPTLIGALRRFTGEVGVPWYRTGALSSDYLIRRTARPRVTAHPPPALPATRGTPPAGQELDFHWSRPAVGGARYVHGFDRNGAYLAAAGSVELPAGAAEHVERPTFDRSTPGYWRVTLPQPHALDPLLPDPFRPQPADRRRGNDDGTRWVTTPTATLLGDITGDDVAAIEAWIWPEHRRYLRRWQTQLRDARTSALNDHGPCAAAVLAAVKATYREGVGRLASTRRSKDPTTDPLYQPYWRSAVIATARANLWRALRKFAVRPIAVDVDAAWFPSDEPDPERLAELRGIPLGDGLGEWRHLRSDPGASR